MSVDTIKRTPRCTFEQRDRRRDLLMKQTVLIRKKKHLHLLPGLAALQAQVLQSSAQTRRRFVEQALHSVQIVA